MSKVSNLNCPGCENPAIGREFEYPGLNKGNFLDVEKIKKCDHCGLFYAWPMPKEKAVNDYYEKGWYYHDIDAFNDIFFKFSVYLAKSRLKLAKSQVELEGSHILDIGAGNAAFGYELGKQNIQCTYHTVEPDRKLAQSYQGYVSKSFASIAEVKNVKYDLITLFQVLEHVPEPIKFVNQIKKLLKPNGKILFEVPHRDDLFKPNVVPHLLFWDVQSLAVFCEKVGLKVLFINTAGMKIKRAKSYFNAKSLAEKARHLVFYFEKANYLFSKMGIGMRFNTLKHFEADKYSVNRQWVRAVVAV